MKKLLLFMLLAGLVQANDLFGARRMSSEESKREQEYGESKRQQEITEGEQKNDCESNNGSLQVNDSLSFEVDNKEQKINTEKNSKHRSMEVIRKAYEMRELGQIGKLKDLTKIIDSIKNNQLFKNYSKQIFNAYAKNEIKKFNELLKFMKEIFPTNKLFLILKDENENTLLHVAISKKDYKLVFSILKYNPEIVSDLLNMVNKQNVTPIDLSVTDEFLLNNFMNFAYATEENKTTNDFSFRKLFKDALLWYIFYNFSGLIDFSAKK